MRRLALGIAIAAALVSACSPDSPEGEAAADAAMESAQTVQVAEASQTGSASADSDAALAASDDLPEDYLRTAWRVEDAEGARYITYLDPDGRYRDIRNGDAWREGAWEVDERERLCFTPDGTNVVRKCWMPDRMDDTGGLIVHGDSGRRVRLEPVGYRPAETSPEPDPTATP